ncbi:MAG: Hpt domain-containing protein [Methylobacter sp.]
MIPDEYLQTFVVECTELLEQMEEALLTVEQAADDPEIINAIFRAAHTIKGSAGMFGNRFDRRCRRSQPAEVPRIPGFIRGMIALREILGGYERLGRVFL